MPSQLNSKQGMPKFLRTIECYKKLNEVLSSNYESTNENRMAKSLISHLKFCNTVYLGSLLLPCSYYILVHASRNMNSLPIIAMRMMTCLIVSTSLVALTNDIPIKLMELKFHTMKIPNELNLYMRLNAIFKNR